MKPIVVVGAFILAVLGFFFLATLLSGTRSGPESSSASAEARGSDALSALSDRARAAGSERGDLQDARTQVEDQNSGKDVASGGRARGVELRLLSEREFLERLRSLGVDNPGRHFEALRNQRADKGAVFVLVTDEENTPVEGARVLFDPNSPETSSSHVGGGAYSKAVRTEATAVDGVVLFTNAEPMSHLLAVEHPAYLTRYFGSVEARAGERTYVEAVLQKARARISGVVRSSNGIPLLGVTVSATHFTEGGVPFAAVQATQVDGKFSLGVLKGSQNLVLARKFGYEDGTLDNIPAGTDTLVITLEEAETATVSGFVTRGSSLDPVERFSVDGETLFDTAGWFRVERNVQPEPQALVFFAEGFEPRTILVTLDSRADVDVGQVALFGEVELNGIVLLESETGPAEPVVGATVSIVTDTGLALMRTTSAGGLFSFRELSTESVQLSVAAAGAAQYQQGIALLSEEPTYVEVLLTRGEYRVAGRILDEESGEPIEGARVEVTERTGLEAVSDLNGDYEISGIPLERFTLRASSSGYTDETSPTLTGTEEGATWDARLKPSGLRMRFTLRGAPAPGGTPVTLWTRIQPTLQAALAAQASINTLRFQDTTNQEGEVTFDVDDGDYFVQVPAYRLHPTLVRADREQTKWLDIALPGVTLLSGRIQNSDGSPVANTSLWLHSGSQDYSTMFLYHADATGNYSIPNLIPRPYALSIIKSVADQSAQHVREVFLSGAPTQNFSVTFPPLTASVRGQLVDENGLGKGGVQIGVEYLDAPHRSMLAGWVGTDVAGNFHIPRLEPGTHILRTAWSQDESVFSDPFVLQPGEERVVNLVAPTITGQHVSGHMLAADGGPLGGNFIYATDSAGHQNGNYFSTMDWAYVGPFDVGSLHVGSYQLDLTAMGCRKRSLPVAVLGSVSGLVVTMDRE